MADGALGVARAGRGARRAAASVLLVGVALLLGAGPAGAHGAPYQIAFTTEPAATVSAGQSFTVDVAVNDKAGDVGRCPPAGVHVGIEHSTSEQHNAGHSSGDRQRFT